MFFVPALLLLFSLSVSAGNGLFIKTLSKPLSIEFKIIQKEYSKNSIIVNFKKYEKLYSEDIITDELMIRMCADIYNADNTKVIGMACGSGETPEQALCSLYGALGVDISGKEWDDLCN